MGLLDTFVAGRESLINGMLRISERTVLNDAAVSKPSAGENIAAELKQAMNGLKAAAFDDKGRVDYARLRGQAIYDDFRACTANLQVFDPAVLPGRETSLAFWINLYNALIIDAVIAFDIQSSVTEGPLGVISFFRRAAYKVGGQRVSCEDIEHGVLRANRGHPYLPGPHFRSADPRCAWVMTQTDERIHFALNCASRSCPPIGVYDAAKIDAQLDLAARNFVAGEIRPDYARNQLQLSRIFGWYTGDFGGRDGIIDFVLRYSTGEAHDWLAAQRETVQLVYLPYNWQLNTPGVD